MAGYEINVYYFHLVFFLFLTDRCQIITILVLVIVLVIVIACFFIPF